MDREVGCAVGGGDRDQGRGENSGVVAKVA